MRVRGWWAALLLLLAVGSATASAQELSPDRRPLEGGGSQGRREGGEKAPDKDGESAVESLFDLFTGSGRRSPGEGQVCTWDSCPTGLQCCCCGDRCVCKTECSFRPCP